MKKINMNIITIALNVFISSIPINAYLNALTCARVASMLCMCAFVSACVSAYK